MHSTVAHLVQAGSIWHMRRQPPGKVPLRPLVGSRVAQRTFKSINEMLWQTAHGLMPGLRHSCCPGVSMGMGTPCAVDLVGTLLW